jgi:hypothetical protein
MHLSCKSEHLLLFLTTSIAVNVEYISSSVRVEAGKLLLRAVRKKREDKCHIIQVL